MSPVVFATIGHSEMASFVANLMVKEDCVHSSAAKIDSPTSETQDTDDHVDTLTTDPLSVAVFHDGQYGIVHKRRISRNVVLRCDTCSARSRHCDHVKRFQADPVAANGLVGWDLSSWVHWHPITHTESPCFMLQDFILMTCEHIHDGRMAMCS